MEIAFQENNSTIFTDSLTIAGVFGKRHDSIIRNIENTLGFEDLLREHKIVVSEYKASELPLAKELEAS